jgi:hypothetical protein
MTRNQINPNGGTYVAKVSSQLVLVQLNGSSHYGGYNATNLKTGRPVRIKTAARLRRPATADERARYGR